MEGKDGQAREGLQQCQTNVEGKNQLNSFEQKINARRFEPVAALFCCNSNNCAGITDNCAVRMDIRVASAIGPFKYFF